MEIHCFGTDKNNLLKKYSEKILFKNNFKKKNFNRTSIRC